MSCIFLFPGQGIYPEELLLVNNKFKEKYYSEISILLNLDISKENYTGHEISSLLLVANSVANTKMVLDKGLIPDAIMGYSIGQYASLVIAEVLSFQDAITLIRKRSE